MKKLLFGVLVLSAAVLLTGCNSPTQLANQQKEAVKNKVAEKVEEKKDEVKEKIEGLNKVKDALTAGKPLKCSTEMADGLGGKSKSEFYTDGKGNSYVEYTSTDEKGNTRVAKIITANGKIYAWDDATKKGTVVSEKHEEMDEVEDSTEEVEEENQAQEYLDESLANFSCRPWVVNASKFAPPSDVEFTDLDKMMEKVQNQMKNVCNMLSGEEKEECLKNANSMGGM